MSRFLSNYSDVPLTLVGFVIFFLLFVLLVGSTFLKSQKALYKHLERLPLDEDSSNKL
ncbi:MAG: cbb3-type cytochrome c oxidase subunit 3 [Bdellovibrionaceae bacterium]|nr:cbb3-type cytochrome c oxidase subunit 3 [Pseudobdellovibrionaceae bacterium]